MIHITPRKGPAYTVDADRDEVLMYTLRERGEVEAICGGEAACATCHVHIDPAWMERVGAPNDNELALLEYSLERRPGSRLSCQIRLTDTLDGLRLSVAAAEG